MQKYVSLTLAVFDTLSGMRTDVLLTGIVIMLIGVGLAGADYVLSEQPRMIAMQEENPVMPPPEIPASSSSSLASSESLPTAASSSTPGVVKKGVSTKKAGGIDVNAVLEKLQLVSKETNEASFILLTVPDRAKVTTSVLLRNNDRAFLFSWMESDDVKILFAALKQTLQEQFSGRVTDLVDETRTPKNGAPVDYLSFIDPALSSERIVFLRIRNRLYELHVAENGDGLLPELVTELSQ